VTVPANAQRIVCVNYLPAWTMLDLNITPLGSGDFPAEQVPPVYAGKWTAIRKVGSVSEPDVESVAALRPDLILGLDSPGYKAPFERLSALAPTASFAAVPSLANWDQLAEQYAETLGATTQLAALKQRYRDRAAAIKTPHGAKLGAMRWAPIAAQQAGQFTLVHGGAAVGRIMGDVGMPLIPAASGTDTTASRYSLEQLNLLADADAILLQTAANGHYSPEAQALADSPVFKTLKAVAGGRVYPITNFFPASYQIVFELQSELESVAKRL
jgi:iron complex transport system substrate-binding protein